MKPQAKRRLWLLVAKHAVDKAGKTPRAALEVLKECPRGASGALIKIEDMLPLFQDFATIDDFKDRIVEALEAYDKTIEDLKKDMDGIEAAAGEVSRDMAVLANRTLSIDASTECALSVVNTPIPPPLVAF